MKYTLMAVVAALVLFASVACAPPVAAAGGQDPSMFGDYDTDVTAYTGVGKVMAAICRVATPRDSEYIYAPSERLFKASGDIQLWGCPNADRATFQAARERYQGWKADQPSTQPTWE